MGKNGVEVIVFNGNNWLNETNIKDQLKHLHLAAATVQYSSELRKQRQELQDCGNHQPCRRRTLAVNFKTKLGFNQHDPIMTQEQSISSKSMTLFACEK